MIDILLSNYCCSVIGFIIRMNGLIKLVPRELDEPLILRVFPTKEVHHCYGYTGSVFPMNLESVRFRSIHKSLKVILFTILVLRFIIVSWWDSSIIRFIQLRTNCFISFNSAMPLVGWAGHMFLLPSWCSELFWLFVWAWERPSIMLGFEFVPLLCSLRIFSGMVVSTVDGIYMTVAGVSGTGSVNYDTTHFTHLGSK